MNHAAELLALKDAEKVSRIYALSLHARALRYDDRDPSFAMGLREAGVCAVALADEYACVAMFVACGADGGVA